MKKYVAAGIILAAAGIFIAGQASAFIIIGKRAVFDIPRPADSYQGQWYVTPQGCSYSRTQRRCAA